MTEIAASIREFIRQEFMISDSGVIRDDLNLLEAEILDSLGIFVLIGFLQERFGVGVAPEEVNLDNFRTLGAISRFVEDKLASA